MSVTVRMVQQMSGSRGDGSAWPPVGGTLVVGEDEAEMLTRRTDSSPPLAELVAEPKAAEPKTPSEPKTPAEPTKTPSAPRAAAAGTGKK